MNHTGVKLSPSATINKLDCFSDEWKINETITLNKNVTMIHMNEWDENKTGYYLEWTFNKQASILSANNKSKTAGRLIVMLYFERSPTLITVFIIIIKPLLPGCLPSPAHKGIHIITRCLTFILSTFIYVFFCFYAIYLSLWRGLYSWCHRIVPVSRRYALQETDEPTNISSSLTWRSLAGYKLRKVILIHPKYTKADLAVCWAI